MAGNRTRMPAHVPEAPILESIEGSSDFGFVRLLGFGGGKEANYTGLMDPDATSRPAQRESRPSSNGTTMGMSAAGTHTASLAPTLMFKNGNALAPTMLAVRRRRRNTLVDAMLEQLADDAASMDAPGSHSSATTDARRRVRQDSGDRWCCAPEQ